MVLPRRKTSDLCSLFQARESNSIDTMASLVTGRVLGAGQFPPKSLQSMSVKIFFSFNPKASFSQQLFLGADSGVGPGLDWRLELRDVSDRSCHVAMDFLL